MQIDLTNNNSLIKKIILSCLLLVMFYSSKAQQKEFFSSVNFDIGTNAFVIDNNDFGLFFCVGYEFFLNKFFSFELKGQVGVNSQRLEEPIFPEILANTEDFILVTEVQHYAFAIYPRFNQELSDNLSFFTDIGVGVESSKSSSNFGNEANDEEQYLGSTSSSVKIYPGAHVGIKIIGNSLSGSLYFGWERVDLGRSMNKLDINQTRVFKNHNKKTEFLQLGFRLSIPLQDQ